MNIYTAIIKEMQSQKQFNHYSITKSLRDKVNNKTIIIDNLITKKNVNQEEFLDVNYSEIKTIIQEIYNEKILDLNRKHSDTGLYYEYELQQSTNISPLINFPRIPDIKTVTKIKTYINNHKFMTLQMIQRGIKIKGTTISDIEKICHDQLGYKIIVKTPKCKSEIKSK